MLILDATNETIEIVTTTTAATDVFVSYVDHTSTGGTAGNTPTAISTATTTTVLAAPAASTQRQVKQLAVNNRGTTTQRVLVQLDVGGTNYSLTPNVTLGAGEMLEYMDGQGWRVIDAGGRTRAISTTEAGTTGRAFNIYKVGTAPEAAGVWYSWHKDSGVPGAWAPGTPGLSGRATDGTAAPDNGCIPVPNASVGANYLTGFTGTTSVASMPTLYDVLWVNSGIVVTTTTAQTINSVAFPARDLTGTADGLGVMVGILVTTATTNAGAVTTISMSYTNSDGTAGKTATIASFPATAVIGSVVWFQLAAGDKGVRSIQTITLGTTLAGGAISLIAAKPIAQLPVSAANIPAFPLPMPSPGVRLYDGATLLPMMLATATTATTINAVATVMEK